MAIGKDRQHRRIERFIDRMPALSTTVGKVLEVCSKTDASPNELNKVISLDPVLTGQVLKLINSAYYSLVDKVTSLPRAITMLGMNTVKNMALSTAIIATVSLGKKSKSLPIEQFWAHSLGVGVAAKLFGLKKGVDIMQREELFFAGLLHDLGKIPFGDEYSAVLNAAQEEEAPLDEMEQMMLGTDHQEVGLLIAEKWKLNTFLADCISGHHSPEKIEQTEYLAFVALADLYINTMEYGSAGNAFPDQTNKGVLLDKVGLSWDEIAAMGEEIAEEIERAKIFLQV